MGRAPQRPALDTWVIPTLWHTCDTDIRRLMCEVHRVQVRPPGRWGGGSTEHRRGAAGVEVSVFGGQVRSLYKPNEEKELLRGAYDSIK